MSPKVLHGAGENRSLFHPPTSPLVEFSSIATFVHPEPTALRGPETRSTAPHPAPEGPDRPQLHSPYYYCFSFLE